MMLQNEEADAGNGPSGSNVVEFLLGPPKGGFTVRFFLSPPPQDGARSTDDQDVEYLNQMASLERAWDSSPSGGAPTGLEGDWAEAQRAQSTTGRAKDEDGDEPKLLAKPVRNPSEDDDDDDNKDDIKEEGEEEAKDQPHSQQPSSLSSKSRPLSATNSFNLTALISDDSKDAEIASLLLGRSATKEEVLQLRAAFAQAIETEAVLLSDDESKGPSSLQPGVQSTDGSSSGAIKPSIVKSSSTRLRQALDSFIQGAGDSPYRSKTSSTSRASRVNVDTSAIEASSSPSSRRHKKRLFLPSDLSKLHASKSFDAPLIRESEPSHPELLKALLRRLRVPRSLYSRPEERFPGRDLMLLVPAADLGPLVSSWEEMERKLMHMMPPNV